MIYARREAAALCVPAIAKPAPFVICCPNQSETRRLRTAMQVTVQLPDAVAQQLGRDADIPRHILEAVALEGYRAGRLSRGQISEMLDLSFFQTEAFLKDHGAELAYSLADLNADRAALDKIVGGR
jgi:predicted HTH domain antitoxin